MNKKRQEYSRGFTLIETLVAISLLTVAIVAPMTLTAQSLQSAYYARDQVTAYYLAQEGIEAVRAVRDGQILDIAESPSDSGINIFGPIPVDQPFIIDPRLACTSSSCPAITNCSGTCPVLQTDGTFYGYDSTNGWSSTYFTRTVVACYVQSDGSCTSSQTDQMRVKVTVSWQTAAIQARTFSISEDLYRWVQDGSGATS